MIEFISGILAMSSFVVGLFFLRFWRKTGDTFFVLFAAAFGVLAANWVGLGLSSRDSENRTYFYLLRLVAFVLILVAIWQKNRPIRPTKP